MFFPRLSKTTSGNVARSPILVIIGLITIGGSMCFVAGGLFLFSAISTHQSEKYCSGFLIIFIGIVLLATCYLAWILTSHRYNHWQAKDETEDTPASIPGDDRQECPPSYDDAVLNV